jgi:aspartate/methionine/tyrosine aminotransferase
MAVPNIPLYVHREEALIPVSDHLRRMEIIPQSKMFLIKQSLTQFKAHSPDRTTYDASQGDGGASLPGVPRQILERAHELQVEHGTGYDLPFGTAAFRQRVAEDYWQLDATTGWGPANVTATAGGRDALLKAFEAMLALGHGRQGDLIIASRVPWISYKWGPYGIGANIMLAPGEEADAWAYTPEAIRACVAQAANDGRKVAGLLITSPDNPTGRTLSVDRQAELAQAALDSGVAFVLFDWIYHRVTDEEPADLNALLLKFSPADRERLIVLDGLTKSLGGSNIRSAHLVAGAAVIEFIVARASHGVIPPFYSMAVAMAAYELGLDQAARSIVEPTNASRKLLSDFLVEADNRHIIGKGYYAFIDVSRAIQAAEFPDSVALGEYLASQHGIAVVPGAFCSYAGNDWIRFSYAMPADKTLEAAARLQQGLQSLIKSGRPA